ncbi:MAG: SPFH domain-containing protein [Clostridiales bacterium]|jgi:membrane protease subunit (stomatin/prohibitin family)|nr:SPFH domain-containing protein [Clostridiales bacterium]
MCFTRQKNLTFGGNTEHIAWVYDASGDRRLSVFAESPHEVLCVKDGAFCETYRNQKAVLSNKRKDGLLKLYFVNVKLPMSDTWGTQERYEYKDAKTGRIIGIGCRGSYAFHICDSKSFIEKIFGIQKLMTKTELSSIMKSKLMDEMSDHFVSALVNENISYEELDLSRKTIAKSFLPILNTSFEKYGIHVEEFIIEGFDKPEILRDRSNKNVDKAEDFEDITTDNERKSELLKQYAGLEKQQMELSETRATHSGNLKRIQAAADKDVEKTGYEAKEMTYKELREQDREDIGNIAAAEAKVREATKIPEVTVIANAAQDGKCPHCGGAVTANQIFCPTCRRKL